MEKKITREEHLLFEKIGSCMWSIQEERKKLMKLCETIEQNGFHKGSKYIQAKKILSQ